MTVRKSLESMMGISNVKQLPDPLMNFDNGIPTFWIETDDGLSLRLNWDLDWEENKLGWGSEAVKQIQLNGAQWCTRTLFKALQETDTNSILSAIHSVFVNWKEHYHTQKKPTMQQLVSKRANRHMLSGCLFSFSITVQYRGSN